MDSEETISNGASTPITQSDSLSRPVSGDLDEAIIRAAKLNKYFGDKHVLKDVDFEVRKQEVVALIGPSGSGKSTLIRCLNGLEKATSGEIYIHGEKLNPWLSTKQLSPIRRELGMVFQNFNLFPHMTVLQNVIEAPLLVRKMPKDQAVALGEKLLESSAGAGEGNRTLVCSLGSCRSTIELRPR
jgi:ABC-type polar amino acid transport system ATPase subunit